MNTPHCMVSCTSYSVYTPHCMVETHVMSAFNVYIVCIIWGQCSLQRIHIVWWRQCVQCVSLTMLSTLSVRCTHRLVSKDVQCTQALVHTWCSDQPWALALPWRHQGFSQSPPPSKKPGQQDSE